MTCACLVLSWMCRSILYHTHVTISTLICVLVCFTKQVYRFFSILCLINCFCSWTFFSCLDFCYPVSDWLLGCHVTYITNQIDVKVPDICILVQTIWLVDLNCQLTFISQLWVTCTEVCCFVSNYNLFDCFVLPCVRCTRLQLL